MAETSEVPATRTPLSLEISFKKSYARENDQGTLTNISLTGAFLEFSDRDIRKGDKLLLIVTVSENLRKIPALVVWTNNHGYGLKFLPKNGRDVRIIDDLVEDVESLRVVRRTCMSDVLKKIA